MRIHKLYLHPNKQGLGLGRIMMEKLEKDAEVNDLSKLHLNVNRFNKSVRFYQKSLVSK